MEIEVRKAGEDDEAFLARLFEEVHAAELIPAGLPEAMVAQLLAMQYRGQTISYRAQFPEGESAIVWLGEERIGRVFVNESPVEVRIVDIAVSKLYRGRGYGTKLLEDVRMRAQAKGVPVRLSVRPGADAMRLYERMGFVAVSSTNMHVEMELRGDGGNGAAEHAAARMEDGSTDVTARLEASRAAFQSLIGKEVGVELSGGVEVRLRVSEARPLETKQPGMVANDSFVVVLEGPMDVVLAPATYRLMYGEAQTATSLPVFLSALGGRGETMQYEAVFNRIAPAGRMEITKDS